MSNRATTGQATALPTETRQGTNNLGMTVGEAARQLGLTPDAIRSRLHRRTLLGEKVDREWRVFLLRQDSSSNERQDERQGSTVGQQESDRQRQLSDRVLVDEILKAKEATITRLDEDVAYLRALLEQSTRERAAERERFDIIHREALNRIEALTSGVPTNLSRLTPEPPGESAASPWVDHVASSDPEVGSRPDQSKTLAAEWLALTDQLVTELGMDLEKARLAAASDLGIAL